MKTQKNKLLLSAISLFLCFTMLIGTTFAWFTDSVTSEGNIIQTGNFKIGMQWSNTLLPADSNEWNDVNGAIFTYNNWEPGYTDVKYVKITNNGNLNLKWKLNIEAEAQVSALADIIDVYYVNPVTVSISSLDGLTSAGKLTKVLEEKVNSTGALTPEQSTILAIAFHMPEDAGNEYQNLSLCDGGFSINLIATQETGESDSFGDDYDIGADWGEDTVNFAASSAISGSDLTYGALTNKVVLGTSDGISATIPAGVKVADGATNLALSVKAVETDENITVGEGQDARSLDVHIEGVSPDNTVPMTVNLGAIFKPGLTETEVKLYHTENGVPVLMTRVASTANFTIHNQYTYDPATGEVSIYVASFSVFSVLQTEASVWDGTSDTAWYNENDTEFTLTTAAQFAGFRDLVDGGNTFEGKTVKLGIDVDLNNIQFDPIGFGYEHLDGQVFKGVFDGNNHTVYNLAQNCWELDTPENNYYDTYTYSTAGGGLFASIKNSTIKNLVVSGANIVFECVDIGVVVGYAQGTCHFENIVVTNSKIANYNRYTGGVVGEVSGGPYGIDTTQGFSHTFKNIVVDSSVKVSGLWGSFGCGMGGVIGGKWGDATVHMENVISATEMDVFNDVTSAYQWYAFRGCGMLIGHTEEPYADGRHSGNATASFLKCENVKVYYGDWVNYTYYQFANQTDAEGNTLWYSNYPWVRAEKGEHNEAFSNPRYGIPLVNGVKVTEMSEEDFNSAVTGYTKIIFDQLYGADTGMYGTATHEGVTVIRGFDSSVSTSVHIVNHNGSENLKFQYWFANGNDTWTTNADGIDMSGMAVSDSTYNIVLPAYADGFSILSDGVVVGTFTLSALTESTVYNIDGTVHSHDFTGDGICACGETCKHAGGTATCLQSAVCTVCGMSYNGKDTNNHVGSAIWSTRDASIHVQSYSCCGAEIMRGSHSGGTANCQTQATCSTCGVKYGNLGGHSMQWANDESYCYKICTVSGCSNATGKASHQWTNGRCTTCGRTPNIVGTISDTNVAKGLDTTISFSISNLPKSASNYTVYVMNRTQQTGIQATATGTMSFNVSSLNTGTYSVAVVDNSTKQWVDAKQFNVVDPGLVKYWSGSSLTSSHASHSGNVFTTTGNGGPDGIGGFRIGLDGGGTKTGGYLIIKFKSSSWLAQGQANTLVGSAFQTTQDQSFVGAAVTSWKYMKISIANNWSYIYLDMLEAVNPGRQDHLNEAKKVGNTCEIEYIAVVTNPNYIG